VLAVMKARDLEEAIELVNATGYGLTSGLESLDDREQDLWQRHVRAGNLYINRPTTGAIVLRQPFGGMGKSAVGPGIKAGGPNYVAPLMTFAEKGDKFNFAAVPTATVAAPAAKLDLSPFSPELLAGLRHALQDYLVVMSPPAAMADDIARTVAAIESYRHWSAAEFHAAHDHFRLLGEDNFRRYLPIEHLRVRVHPDDTLFDVFARASAARAAGCRLTISSPPTLTGPAADAVRLLDELTDPWGAAIEFVVESDAELARAIQSHQADRVRYAAPGRVPLEVRTAAAEVLQYIADTPPLAHGRVELLWYFQEQSLSHLYHRYGNLGLRASEPRDEPI